MTPEQFQQIQAVVAASAQQEHAVSQEADRPASMAEAAEASNAPAAAMVASATPLASFEVRYWGEDILVPKDTDWSGRERSGLKKLELLLLLMGNPAYLDDPASTVQFVELLPNGADRHYFAFPAMGSFEWRGDNQFQVEDSRRAFLAAHRQQILDMIPTLPLTVADVRRFGTGVYDEATGTLEIKVDTGEAWPQPGRFSFAVALPEDLPAFLTLAPQEARKLVEDTAARYPDTADLWNAQFTDRGQPSATLVNRYEITGVRPTEKGVVLDTAALDRTAYDNRGLTHEIYKIAPQTKTSPSPQARDVAAANPYLDPILPRMLAAKLKPELLANSSFIAETHRIRREMERAIQRSGGYNFLPEVTNWPMLMSSVMLNSNIAPGDEDLAAAKDWLSNGLNQVGETVT